MRGRKLLLCVLVSLFLNEAAIASQYAYQVTFADKAGSLPLNNPLAFLSQRSLDRRTHQSIGVDFTDQPVSPAYLDSVVTLTGGLIHLTSRWLNFCVVLVTDSNSIHALNGKSYISSIKLVGAYADILHNRSAVGPMTPPRVHRMASSPVGRTTGTQGYYNATWDQTILVHGDYLHDQGHKGTGKLIAILDAGFIDANTHPGFDSLNQSGRLIDVHDFTYGNENVYAYDDHGMKVLSTMAGYVPNTYVGSAPLASYALYVTEDDNHGDFPIELCNLIAGAERADSVGADIITISLGYDLFDSPFTGQAFSDLDGKTTTGAIAANMATKKGMLFVSSAGNDGSGIGGWGNHILTPSDADSALTVGSVDISGTNASSSGYGPNAAGQTKPDVCTLGQPAAVFDGANAYLSENGTSFSTPEIAGWAACLWEANSSVTPYALRMAIDQSANQYATPNTPTTQMGYGIPNFMIATEMLDINDAPNPHDNPNWVLVNPNPFTSSISVEVVVNTQQVINFKLLDVTGKVVGSFSKEFNKGYNPTAVFTVSGNLPKGTYILKASGTEAQKVMKLQKM